MPAIPAKQLQKGHQVVQHDGSVKIVDSVVAVKPECICETFITYSDATTDQFCDNKNIVVRSATPNYPRKPR